MNIDLTKIEEKVWLSIQNESNIGLLEGLSGIALFYKFLTDINSEEQYNEKLLSILDKINNLISEEEQSFSLCSGLSGYGLLLLNLNSQNITIDEDYFNVVDSFLLEELVEQSVKNNYDFLHGSMGIAVYLINRCKVKKSTLLINAINDFTQKLSDKIIFDFENFVTREPAFIKEKHIFFGIAHGIAGYINFLTYLNQNFEELKVDVKNLVKISLDYLQSFKQYNNTSKQFYPHSLYIDSQTLNPAMFGWCQGDLGIALSLFNAGELLNDESLKNEAILLVENSRKISFEESNIDDFGICHGATGVIIQYYLLGIKMNIDVNQEIKKWLKVVNQQTENNEIFLAHQGHGEYESDFGLLTGAAGLGIVLLTLENKISSDWLVAINLH